MNMYNARKNINKLYEYLQSKKKYLLLLMNIHNARKILIIFMNIYNARKKKNIVY